MELEGSIPWLVCMGGQCRGRHRHVVLAGEAVGKAQRHPARFCDAMARGWREVWGGAGAGGARAL